MISYMRRMPLPSIIFRAFLVLVCLALAVPALFQAGFLAQEPARAQAEVPAQPGGYDLPGAGGKNVSAAAGHGHSADQRGAQLKEMNIQVVNRNDAPLVLRHAQASIIKESKDPSSERLVAVSTEFTNKSDRAITGAALSIGHPQLDFKYYVEIVNITLQPGGSLSKSLGEVEYPPVDMTQMHVAVEGVRFADGSLWGRLHSAGAGAAGAPPGGTGQSGGITGAGLSGGVSNDTLGQGPSYPGIGSKVYSYPGDEIKRFATTRVDPTYPSQARSEGIKGTVIVEIVVDTKGDVMSARVIPGTEFGIGEMAHPLLQEAAIEAARQWKFKPPRRRLESVGMIGKLRFDIR